jgi:catechol 2,3-dioxygenase-like lactoylglutathione lyase family enzyme
MLEKRWQERQKRCSSPIDPWAERREAAAAIPLAAEDPALFSYVTLGTNDFERAVAFYDAVMAPLGQARFYYDPDSGWAGWGLDDPGPHLNICRPFDGKDASVGNGSMVSLLAPSREAVDLFHAAALANGGRDEGPPGLRPHYGPTFYAAYVRDPDGNKLNAVCYAGAPAGG